MRILVAGAGKVGWNLSRELLEKGHEVVMIESDRESYSVVEQEVDRAIRYGDATEMWVLERAGIEGSDMVIAVTGDDEDNLLICQMARDRYRIERIIARINNPRNREWFDLLDIRPYVSATDLILRLIEHEVPEYGLVQLLDLPEEGLEIIEVLLTEDSASTGRTIGELELPEGSLVISVLRDGRGFVPGAGTELRAGDEVLAVLHPALEDELQAALGSRREGRPAVGDSSAGDPGRASE